MIPDRQNLDMTGHDVLIILIMTAVSARTERETKKLFAKRFCAYLLKIGMVCHNGNACVLYH
jgi:hypothetical protein